jgi:hypothetical protein
MTALKVPGAFVVTCFLASIAARSVAADPTPEIDIRSADGKVVIAADQIRSYEWATHILTLVPNVRDELATRLRKDRAVSGIPFAVTVGGNVIYTGTFTTVMSSKSFSTPVIVVDAQLVKPKLGADQLRIQLGYPTVEFFKGEDPRADRRIREALKAEGKLTERPPNDKLTESAKDKIGKVPRPSLE